MRRLLPRLVLLGLALPLAVTASVAAVADSFQPASVQDVHIAGVLGERMQINVEKRLLKVDEAALIAGFRQRPGAHPWIGEHAGKFLHAAANAYRHDPRPELRASMDRIAAALIASQTADGYLGTYADADRWTSWDVWSHKYNLIGLLSYHELTGDANALEACRRMASLLVTTFGPKPGQRDILSAGTHEGMAATSVLEPICLLYQRTHDPRLLDFARYLVDAWEQPHGPHLLSTLLSSGEMLRVGDGKAYEILSNLVGLLELHRITGEEKYFTAVRAGWDDIRQHHLYITGTLSAHEYLQPHGVLPAEDVSCVGEGCTTVTWLQLTWQLLRLTGEARYGDEIERTVMNQILAEQEPGSGLICYFRSPNGRRDPAREITCCGSSVPRALAQIPQFTAGTMRGGPVVVLYTAGTMQLSVGDPGSGKTVRIDCETRYPADGGVTLRITPSTSGENFPLWLRVPAWCQDFRVECNGAVKKGAPGGFVGVERTWKTGDEVHIHLALSPHLVAGGDSYPHAAALCRGPQVFALDRFLNPGVPALTRAAWADASRTDVAVIDAAEQLPPGWAGRSALRVDGLVSGADGKRPQPLLFVPYAEAQHARIWISRPDAVPTGPVSVTSGGRELQSGDSLRQESITDERLDTWRVVPAGINGGIPRGENVWFGVELLKHAAIRRVAFSHGEISRAGGWFQSKRGRPEVQVRRTEGAEWETIGRLADYPWLDYSMVPAFTSGRRFELVLPESVTVSAVRVIGIPARQFTTCAELSAYAE